MVAIKPVRLQLSRRRGFRLQELSRQTNGLIATFVARPTRYGNPWSVGQHESGKWFVEGPRLTTVCYCGNREGAHLVAVKFFRQHMAEQAKPELPPSGTNLACWCPPELACHADALLELSNPPTIKE